MSVSLAQVASRGAPAKRAPAAGSYTVRPGAGNVVEVTFDGFSGTLTFAGPLVAGGGGGGGAPAAQTSPPGAPPPGASPFTVSGEVGAGAARALGAAAAAPPPPPPADAADLITADWGAGAEADDAPLRPVAKRARNAAAAAAGDDDEMRAAAPGRRVSGSRAAAPAAAAESGGGGADDALVQSVLPAGSAAEDEGNATLVGAAWVALSAGALGAASPSPRWGAAAASVDGARVVVYGGQDASDAVRGDTWALDTSVAAAGGDAWACRSDDADAAAGGAGGASPRMWHTLVGVPDRNFLVAIGKVEGAAPSTELEIDVFDTSIDLW